MIKCFNCGSYAVESTGVVYTTYPEQYEYKCSDCGKVFTVSNNLKALREVDFSYSSDVTYRMDTEFFNFILDSGTIPETLNYYNESYHFYKCLENKYYYKNKQNELIHLCIDKALIHEAEELHEAKTNFFKKVEQTSKEYMKV